MLWFIALMQRLAHIAVVILLAGYFLFATEAASSERSHGTLFVSDDPELSERFDKGFSLYEAGEYERSIEHFYDVIQNDITYRNEEHGYAAYWYGQALEALGRAREALTFYDATLQVLDVPSMQLSDAYVRGVFAEEEEVAYSSATDRYLEMIGRLGEPLDNRESDILREHIAELCLILPQDVALSAGLERCEQSVPGIGVAPGSGSVLVRWWRGENLNVATRDNERLQEHLQRVAYAREHYVHNGRLEDRGEVYIRFGPPDWKREVQLDELSDFGQSQQLSVAIGTGFAVERNEYWIYPGVHSQAHFLFVWDREEGYRLGDASELIPRSLTSSGRNAPLALTVMEYVYRQLSVHAHDYAGTYNQVADYKSKFDLISTFGPRGGPGDLEVPPSSFVQMTMSEARDLDREIRRLRAENIPSSSTDIDRSIEDLAGAVRTARFLSGDGSTRTEVYWTALGEEFEPNRRIRRMLREEDIDDEERDGYVMLTTLVTHSEDFEEHARIHEQQQFGPFSEEEMDGLVPPQTYAISGTSVDYYLSVQWDQYVMLREDDAESLEVGPRVKVQRMRSEPIRALTSDAGTLEMSDLKPLIFVSSADGATIEENTIVYPYHRLTPNMELALYFEVYNLQLGEDNQARFSAEYEVTREVRRGFFGRLLGRSTQVERTTVVHEYDHDGSRAQEHIIVDLADFDAERANTLEIVLRVRDAVSGQEVERSLAFDIVADDA